LYHIHLNKENLKVKKLIALILSAVSITAFAQTTINGAGATFPAPLYSKWADAYNKATNIRVNYQSVGSGAGLKQIEARTVTFGASDMPLTDDRLAAMGVFQFPTVIGGVVPVINLKGVEPGSMRLSGTVMADIFLGKIKRWNDPAITALNPALKLPDQDIVVVRRADGSGTTFIWTNYLSKVSKEFKDTIGEGTAVNWKVGAGGKGNEGVAAMVRQLPGTLGYVEYAYVKQTKMNWVNVQNAAGTWVAPTEDNFKAAAANADWNRTYFQILTDQKGRDAWPLTGATFILVHVKPEKPEDVKATLTFFDWAFENGDKMADELDYVVLPPAVKNKIRSDWKRLGLK
jgi:phosphate transport system substrate-binding protein